MNTNTLAPSLVKVRSSGLKNKASLRDASSKDRKSSLGGDPSSPFHKAGMMVGNAVNLNS